MRRRKTVRLTPSKEQPDLAKIKEYFGPYAARYTDAQLYQLDRELGIGASLLLELYFQRKGAQQKARQVFDKPDDRR